MSGQMIEIIAWENVMDKSNGEEPIPVDTMSKANWQELGISAREHASSLLGFKVHQAKAVEI